MDDFNLFRDVPLWGAFFVLAGIFIRQIVPWRQLTLNAEQQIRKEMRDRIEELKNEHLDVTNRLLKCEKECADHKIQTEQKINGMQRQHMAEQISIVKTVVDIFPDAPQLQLLLRALQTGQRSVEYLGNVTGDADAQES